MSKMKKTAKKHQLNNAVQGNMSVIKTALIQTHEPTLTDQLDALADEFQSVANLANAGNVDLSKRTDNANTEPG